VMLGTALAGRVIGRIASSGFARLRTRLGYRAMPPALQGPGVVRMMRSGRSALTSSPGSRTGAAGQVSAGTSGRVVTPQTNPTVRRFSSLEELNQAANAPQPNTRYEYGSYSWTTDARGRVSVAEGLVTLGPGGRNSRLQTQIGNQGASTDVGFHLIADSFNGPTNRLNVVPGNGVRLGPAEPNLNQGAWKRFENQIRSLVRNGDTVDVVIEAVYNPGNTSTRPDLFRASYRIDGGDWLTRDFLNRR
jgi:hypothetical protein